ncbi:ATP-binding protein [Paenibacillus sp. TY11]|uniref:ATP-binding protein n=1 Tax=Paenibacillus sp. TY11 TaxID=3448633 RepID=UPI001652B5D6
MDNNERVFINSAESEELPIHAMARVVIQLGEQLIENEIVALLELIKNSYDADAKNVVIEINTVTQTNFGQGYIKISDNGNGMNKEQISKGFLLISTTSKSDKSRSVRHDRIPLGEKGVGRLSTQRLAKYLNLRTKAWKKDEEFLLSIDWDKFNDDVTLGSVTAFLDTKEFNIHEFDSNGFDAKYLPKQIDENDFGFTELYLVGLNNVNFWDQKGIDRILGQEVLRLISPFKKNDSIDITIELTNTEFSKKIVRTESIDEEFLEDAAMYKVDFGFSYPTLSLSMSFKPMFYKRLEGKEPREGLPKNYMENHIAIDENLKSINIEEYNDKLKSQLKKTIVNNNISYADPGSFKGVLYIYNYAIEQLQNEFYESVATKYSNFFNKDKDVKGFLKDNASVKIYRDKFRVLPYGNVDNDWLGLTKLSQTSGSFFGPKVANTIGYVDINSVDNNKLKEMTNRQGFILDPYGENFLAICREVAILVSKEVRRQTDVFGKKYPRLSNPNAHEEVEEIIHKASSDVKEMLSATRKIADRLTEEMNSTQLSLFQESHKDELVNKAGQTINNIVEKTLNITSSLEKASEEMKAAKRLYNYSKDELSPLLELSALGIIAEALTHELNKSIINTRFRAKNIQNEVNISLKSDQNQSETLKKIYGEARLIEAESNSIDRQVKHLAPGYRQRRKAKDKVILNKELKNIYKEGVMSERAEKHGIKINLLEEGNITIQSSLGFIIQIFDNLYINSEYWLQRYYNDQMITNKEFNIKITEHGSVQIWDSGLGIDPVIEERLFLPFETQKDDGRGLGLYIVTSILELNDSIIRLLPQRNIHNRKYIFEIDFSKALL